MNEPKTCLIEITLPEKGIIQAALSYLYSNVDDYNEAKPDDLTEEQVQALREKIANQGYISSGWAVDQATLAS